jgi:hypothetical protein
VASKRTPAGERFEDVFVRIRPEVLFVKDIDVSGHLDAVVKEQCGEHHFEDPENYDELPMAAIHVITYAFLDGGLGLVENDLNEDAPRQDAWERWVEEREASGEGWDEDDFHFDHDWDFDAWPISTGSYLIGSQVIRACLRLLPFTWADLPSDYSSSDPQLPDLCAAQWSTKDTLARAEIIADGLKFSSWDSLVRKLNQPG